MYRMKDQMTRVMFEVNEKAVKGKIRKLNAIAWGRQQICKNKNNKYPVKYPFLYWVLKEDVEKFIQVLEN